MLAARGRIFRSALLGASAVLLALVPPATQLTTSGTALLPFAPASAHEAYAYSLVLMPFRRNALAREWLTASERALLAPEPIAAPFERTATFATSTPSAVGFAFTGREGQRIRMDTDLGDPSVELFVDLFRATDRGLERVASGLPLPAIGEAVRSPIEVDVLEETQYVLRIQPALAPRGSGTIRGDSAVSVRIKSSPLLAFPVQGADVRAIWSGFGAERDGGAREHRGVDIFAPRGTMAVAATDAWVIRVETTRRGGNVVWLQPLFGNMRLYYAHLEEPYVERGQFVLAGEPIGAVGNTGNALTTPPHLHFGVYVRKPGVRGGARDPARFLR
jgi:peptidoglycan LD-endopeptidase LytH